MGRAFLTNISRVCLLLSTLASLISIGGGGLVLPPFKSTPWFKTNTTNVGIYGACLSTGLASSFFVINEDWKSLQESQCVNMFTSPSSEIPSLTGRLSSRDEIMISSIHALAMVLTVSALITSRIAQPQAFTTLAFAAFIFQSISFGFAVYQFKQVWTDLAAVDESLTFGIGMYLSGSCCLVLFLAGFLGWGAIKASGSGGYKEYASFRESQDTYY